jgi:hypothetical protein
MNRIAPLLAALPLALALAAQEASAGGRHGGGRPGHGHQQGLSAGQAAEVARRQTGGRVLAVKPSKEGYRVKVLTPKGEVRYVPVDGGRR